MTTALEQLWAHGHAAYAVGGGLRDVLLGREPHDWDIATDALPDELLELFAGGRYENRFGTVSTPDGLQITTFRRDHVYRDHRRPDSVTFTKDVEEDLARRDFTVNALAWGRGAGEGDTHWVDPWAGRSDLASRTLRTVGDPAVRFDEDALRLLRAARFSGELGFEIEPGTLVGMRSAAPAVRHVSAERIGQEVARILRSPRPSEAFRVLADTGILHHALPELAAQIGVPQNKRIGGDLWDHALAATDAAAEREPRDTRLVLAALVHDIGKPTTWRESRTFLAHEQVGADMVEPLLARLGVGRREVDHIRALVRWHMFDYSPEWSDAAVRRFMRRVGPDLVDELLLLREADNVGSGLPREAGALDTLRERIAAQRASGAPLSLGALAIDGSDLQAELGSGPGPHIGRLLDRLLDSVIADPARNHRAQLLHDARAWASEDAARASAGGHP